MTDKSAKMRHYFFFDTLILSSLTFWKLCAIRSTCSENAGWDINQQLKFLVAIDIDQAAVISTSVPYVSVKLAETFRHYNTFFRNFDPETIYTGWGFSRIPSIT
jgi:hypothetical protein